MSMKILVIEPPQTQEEGAKIAVMCFYGNSCPWFPLWQNRETPWNIWVFDGSKLGIG